MIWLRRICPCARLLNGRSGEVFNEQIHLGLDVAQGTGYAELTRMVGLEAMVEHLAQQRLRLVELVPLILQLDASLRVVVNDLAPRVQEIHDTASDAP